MTVENIYPMVTYHYTGPGDYGYDFQIFRATDLEVVHISVDGVESTWSNNLDYTVTLNSDLVGGVIHATNIATTGQLRIRRFLLPTQETDWLNNERLDENSIEQAMDKVTMLIQQLETTMNYASLLFAWQGEWAVSTVYAMGDLVIGSLGNIYRCTIAHTSNTSTFANDLAAGYWTLAIDMVLATSNASDTYLVKEHSISDDPVYVDTLLHAHNLLINPRLDHWFRSTSQSTSGYGSVDRWANTHNGGTKAIARGAVDLADTIPNRPTYYLSHTLSGQSATGHYALSMYKHYDLRGLSGQTVTFGVYIRAATALNFSVDAMCTFGTGGSSTVYLAPLAPKRALAGSTVSFTKHAFQFEVPDLSAFTFGTTQAMFTVRIWYSAGADFNVYTNSLGLQSGTIEWTAPYLVRGLDRDNIINLDYQTDVHACASYYSLSYVTFRPASTFYNTFVFPRAAGSVNLTATLQSGSGMPTYAVVGTGSLTTVVQLTDATGTGTARLALDCET